MVKIQKGIMEKQISIEKIIKDGCPEYAMIYMEADVVNSISSQNLIQEFEQLTETIKSEYEIPDINRRPAIAATRKAYKTFGKDPNRYRPSQEQLMRRVVRGLDLNYVSSLVDAGNILSLKTGCSVGVFDRERIEGDSISLGVGKEDEPYEGIGRGVLNIVGLPVLRDSLGGFGTPTSDNERTKTVDTTRKVSITVHVFDCSSVNLEEISRTMIDLFTRFCSAEKIEVEIFR